MPEYYHGRGAEKLALMEALQTMPERRIVEELQALDVSMHIYAGNLLQLSRFIAFLQNDPSNYDLGHMTTKEKSRAVHYELARLLQNHVASVKSLVDHTKKMTGRLYKHGEFPDYQPRVDDFKRDPLVQLVQSLRNILLHDESAPLVFHGTLDDDGDTTNEFGLDVASLLRHKRHLSPGAKKYLRTACKLVDIPTIIREYDSRVTIFYDWFGRRQQEIHAEELSRLAEKRRKLSLLLIDDGLDKWFFDPDPHHALAPSDRGLFLELFDIREFEALEALPAGSSERADLAVVLLKSRYAVPAELEEKLRRAYADPKFFDWGAFAWNVQMDDEA